MKHKLLLALCLFGVGVCQSQQVSIELISVSGQHDTNDTNQLTWIIGETISESISNSSVTLNHGIFQSNLNNTLSIDYKINGLKVDIYPNPTIDILNIEFENSENQELKYTLTDIQGKIILHGNIKNNENQKQIDFSSLATGTYLLNFSEKQNLQTFKIIKK